MPDSNRRPILHLLPNAHLDPVWLWDWREGLNEGLITVRAVLDLMDEYPDLTFMRGESVIYEHIQKNDPAMFKRVLGYVEAGRWDVVGGTVVQPDTNLASTEVLCRQFERGLSYFEKNLGVRPTVAWQADSFGHTPGLPNILSAFGMDGFTFTRPQRAQFPLDSPAFWWEGDWKNRILCYRQHWLWYCSERDNLPKVLDETAEGVKTGNLIHAGVLFGLGNHGGGPTRRHLREIEQWKQSHPEVEVRFSTLHRFFAALKDEVASKPEGAIPTVRGEMGYCLRGCYSSVQKFKSLYRNAEAQVADAETTRSLIGASTQTQSTNLAEAWDALLFNAFHDILPGSSIERAFEEQSAWIGMALHQARGVKFAAINRLAQKVDTSVPPPRHPDRPTDVPLLLWNPLPRPFKGLVELEASLDYRPIFEYQHRADELPVVVYDHEGEPALFQVIATEHTSMPDLPWRKRVVTPVEIPALGWTMLRLGWRENAEAKECPKICTAKREGNALEIGNGEWSLVAGEGTVRIQRQGRNFFSSQRNLEIRVVEDPGGSWGGMLEEKESYCLEQLREVWKLEKSEILEEGPLRAKLWTRWEGENSWLDLTFVLAAGSPSLTVEGRMLFNERSARVKLVLPCGGELEYDMPGGRIPRDAEGQVPGGRWVTRTGPGGGIGFASDVLSDFDATADELRVTLARASRYANDVLTLRDEKVWQPAVDCGELKFRCCLFGLETNPDHAADSLLFAPATLVPLAAKGPWPRRGSLGSISPDSMRLLSAEEMGAGKLKIRIQNRGGEPGEAVLHQGGNCVSLGKLGPGEIKTSIVSGRAGDVFCR